MMNRSKQLRAATLFFILAIIADFAHPLDSFFVKGTVSVYVGNATYEEAPGLRVEVANGMNLFSPLFDITGLDGVFLITDAPRVEHPVDLVVLDVDNAGEVREMFAEDRSLSDLRRDELAIAFQRWTMPTIARLNSGETNMEIHLASVRPQSVLLNMEGNKQMFVNYLDSIEGALRYSNRIAMIDNQLDAINSLKTAVLNSNRPAWQQIVFELLGFYPGE